MAFSSLFTPSATSAARVHPFQRFYSNMLYRMSNWLNHNLYNNLNTPFATSAALFFKRFYSKILHFISNIKIIKNYIEMLNTHFATSAALVLLCQRFYFNILYRISNWLNHKILYKIRNTPSVTSALELCTPLKDVI